MVMLMIVSYTLLKVGQLLLLLLDDVDAELPDAHEVELVRLDEDSHSVLHELLVQVLDVEDHGGVDDVDLGLAWLRVEDVVDLVRGPAGQPGPLAMVPCSALWTSLLYLRNVLHLMRVLQHLKAKRTGQRQHKTNPSNN